jgi:hypothetical protein
MLVIDWVSPFRLVHAWSQARNHPGRQVDLLSEFRRVLHRIQADLFSEPRRMLQNPRESVTESGLICHRSRRICLRIRTDPFRNSDGSVSKSRRNCLRIQADLSQNPGRSVSEFRRSVSKFRELVFLNLIESFSDSRLICLRIQMGLGKKSRQIFQKKSKWVCCKV